METWIDLYWYPTINVFVFGFLTLYFSQYASKENFYPILAGLIFWDILVTGQYSIGVGALWEVWSKSLSTLFITPMTLEEFIAGLMVGGLIKSLMVFMIVSLVALVLYQFSIFSLGFILIIYFLQLMVFSWSTGMFVLGLIFRIGTDIQSLSWGLIYLLQPLVGIYYPVSVLPPFFQPIAYMIPITYVFESARKQFLGGSASWDSMILATVLNMMYLLGSYLFLRISFDHSKKSGTFARMEN